MRSCLTWHILQGFYFLILTIVGSDEVCSVAVWSSVADMSSHLVTNNERSSFHQ